MLTKYRVCIPRDNSAWHAGVFVRAFDSRLRRVAIPVPAVPDTGKVWGPIYKISYDLAYDYRKFIVRSTCDSDLTCAEISLREYRKLIYDTIFDDITILHVNLTYSL